MKIILDLLLLAFTPSVWFRMGHYDPAFDKWCMEKAADPANFSNFSTYTVELAGKTIWIENHPYASWNEYERGAHKGNARPSRINTLRLQRMMNAARYQTSKP